MKLISFFVLSTILTFNPVEAKIQTKSIIYQDNGIEFEGYLAWDDAVSGPRPGVLIIHEWKGLGGYEKMRAEMLAKEGYIAFAADVYGKGVRPATNEEASAEAGKLRKDRPLLRSRANAGLETLRRQEGVDHNRIAAIGYCFGGGAVLELARSGAEFKGAVSFHGNLDTPNPDDAKSIKAKILVLTGASDPVVPHETVGKFSDEMTSAGVDWQLVYYGNAVHAFSNPNAGERYDAKADKRSWQATLTFFNEIFGK